MFDAFLTIMKISFKGVAPAYRTKDKTFVIPISAKLEQPEREKIIKVCNNPKNLLNEGAFGIVYDVGEKIVVKRSKENGKRALLNEALNMDTLYDTIKAKPLLNQIQVGIEYFSNQQGSWLVSKKVNGQHLNTTNINEKNLASLMKLIINLDSRPQRILFEDLHPSNILVTKNKASFIDLSDVYIAPLEKYEKERAELPISYNYDFFCADFLPSNLCTFEIHSLSKILSTAQIPKARQIFKEYLKLKTQYLNEVNNSLYKGENEHYTSYETALKTDKNAPEAELRKMQIAFYTMLKSSRAEINFETPQFINYFIESTKNFFNKQLETCTPETRHYWQDNINIINYQAEAFPKVEFTPRLYSIKEYNETILRIINPYMAKF